MLKDKKCYTCQKILKTKDFNKNKGRSDGLNSICKECSRTRSKQYYRENHEKHIKVVYANKQKYLKQIDEIIAEAKSDGCYYCDEKDERCLDFHHKDASTKLYNISNLRRSVCKNKLKEEIIKCLVVCSNCHRKIHIKEKIGCLGNAPSSKD